MTIRGVKTQYQYHRKPNTNTQYSMVLVLGFDTSNDNALFYEINSSEFYTKIADKSFLRKLLLAKLSIQRKA